MISKHILYQNSKIDTELENTNGFQSYFIHRDVAEYFHDALGFSLQMFFTAEEDRGCMPLTAFLETANAHYFVFIFVCDQVHRKPDPTILNKGVYGAEQELIGNILRNH